MKEENCKVNSATASKVENQSPHRMKQYYSRYKFKSAKEIHSIEFPPIIYIVENLLTEGLTILGGKPKAGKSFLCMHLALNITTGKKALNYFDVMKSDIIYFALEDNLSRVQRRINKMIAGNSDATVPENLFFLENHAEYLKLNNGGLAELETLLFDRPSIKLIIIDTYGRSIADQGRKDGNLYQKDYDLLASLQDFALRKGICILIVHHLRKTEAEDVFDEISGTLGVNGAVDTMIVLKKKGKDTRLYVRGRDIEDTEYLINFDKETCNWNIIGQAEPYSNLTPEREEILDLLTFHNKPMRAGEIAQELGKEQSNVSHLIKSLLDEGIIFKPKYGYYQIVSSSIETTATA